MRNNSIDGLPIIDAKKTITLTVTNRDINGADTKDPADCVAARACRRELHATEARVHLGRVYIKTSPGAWTRYLTPPSLRQEIISFDRGGSFEPGDYVLHVPHPAKRLGKRTGSAKTYVRRGKKRASPTMVKNVRTGPA